MQLVTTWLGRRSEFGLACSSELNISPEMDGHIYRNGNENKSDP